MSVHIHTMRIWCARVFLVLSAPLLLTWVWAPESGEFKLAQVSGRVTCADTPFRGWIIFVRVEQGGTDAIGLTNSEGSFELHANGRRDQRGAVPGEYRVYVRPRAPDQAEPLVDSKYLEPATTDLVVLVGPDWNHFRFDLH
jgi:hypothetical protein